MGEGTKIEWTTHTANFWWGCQKVSDGCKNCYAEQWSNRWGKEIWGPPSIADREYKKAAWKDIPRWNKTAASNGIRERVFVQSMSDFFEDHPQVVEWRRDALHLMSQCKSLDFQILTKRPQNIVRMIESSTGRDAKAWCSDNRHCWFGTSVEDQEQADERIPHLLGVPAAVRFLSCEPLLGPVTLEYESDVCHCGENVADHGYSSNHGAVPVIRSCLEGGIHWVIAGAESGHGARPMDLDWVRSLRDQCLKTDVPFFFKQMLFDGKKVSLPVLDGEVWAQMPEVEENHVSC